MSWEDTLNSWAAPPSASEAQRCENTEKAICDALNNHPTLAAMDISVFTQGSYKAHTNVRLDSDVDICVLNNDQIFHNYIPGATNEDFGLTSSQLTFKEFKDMIGKALVDRFGSGGVARGNKAFDVHANTYRVDADVVPTFEYRHYYKLDNGGYGYYSGVKFITDDGKSIENYPDQTYESGVDKNNATSRKYKRAVRIIKRLRNKMQEDNIAAAKNAPSFLLESMVWNATNSAFVYDKYYDIMREVLAQCFNATLNDADCKEWCEVNNIKYLFHSTQPWTREQAHSFLSAAWDYLGYQ